VNITRRTKNFEEHNDKLAVLDPSDIHQNEFVNIQERFYSLAGKIENIINIATNTSNHETRINNSEHAVVVKKRRVKLPDAPLPTFDGGFEGWLSFKNSLNNLIGSQTDLCDVDKLQYLKSALVGNAANKLKIIEIDGLNYTKAWELLERSYEVRRILIARHLSMILTLLTIEKESTIGLSKLADDAQ